MGTRTSPFLEPDSPFCFLEERETMQLGILGDDTTGPEPLTAPTYTDGFTLWATPSAALTAVQGLFSNLSTAFSGTQTMYNVGLLTPPAVLLLLVLSAVGGGGRR